MKTQLWKRYGLLIFFKTNLQTATLYAEDSVRAYLGRNGATTDDGAATNEDEPDFS